MVMTKLGDIILIKGVVIGKAVKEHAETFVCAFMQGI